MQTAAMYGARVAVGGDARARRAGQPHAGVGGGVERRPQDRAPDRAEVAPQAGRGRPLEERGGEHRVARRARRRRTAGTRSRTRRRGRTTATGGTRNTAPRRTRRSAA